MFTDAVGRTITPEQMADAIVDELPFDPAPVKVKKDDANMTVAASSNAWVDVDATGSAAARALDVVIPGVEVGQWVTISPGFVVNNTGAVVANFDVATIVAGVAVHRMGGAAGIAPWYAASATERVVSAPHSYQLQAGDIENGSVRLRLQSKINNAVTTRTIVASAGFELTLVGSGPFG